MERVKRPRVFAVALLLSGLFARTCGAGTHAEDGTLATQQTQATPVVRDTATAAAAARSSDEVLVQGIARNAKLGAVVVNDNLHVYCLDIDRWPAETIDQPVMARGRLELSDEFAAPADEAATGTEGPVWILRNCRLEPR